MRFLRTPGLVANTAIVALALAANACGPNYRTAYEADSTYDRCNTLDRDPSATNEDRGQCWAGWQQYYSNGQSPDRVQHARERLAALQAPPQNANARPPGPYAQNTPPQPPPNAPPPPQQPPPGFMNQQPQQPGYPPPGYVNPPQPAQPYGYAAPQQPTAPVQPTPPPQAPPPQPQPAAPTANAPAAPPGNNCASTCRDTWNGCGGGCQSGDAACVARCDDTYRDCMRGCY